MLARRTRHYIGPEPVILDVAVRMKKQRLYRIDLE
jgi:hypothetical protein